MTYYSMTSMCCTAYLCCKSAV